MEQYIIPANSKKSQLIFGLFRTIDLMIILITSVITLLFLLVLPGDDLFVMVIKVLPLGIGILLVVPIPNYHNVLVFLREAMLYIFGEKEYVWKGWCATSEEDGSKTGKSSN